MTGFYMTFNDKGLFFECAGVNITDKIARKFIHGICDYKELGDAIRKKALYDTSTLKEFKKRICKATLEEKTTANGYKYYSIHGNNFTANYPVEDFEKDIIIL